MHNYVIQEILPHYEENWEPPFSEIEKNPLWAIQLHRRRRLLDVLCF